MRHFSLALALIQSAFATPIIHIHAHEIAFNAGHLHLKTVTLHYPHQQTTLHLNANKATIDPNGLIALTGDVIFQDGDNHLTMQTMDIDPTTHRIHSNSNVEGQYNGQYIKAPTFSFALAEEQLHFPKGMTLSHPLPKETKAQLSHWLIKN